MGDGPPIDRHTQPDPPVAHGVDWIAVLFELVPLTSILVAVWFTMGSSDGPWLLALLPLAASGAGWLKIDRLETGCALAFGRGVVLAVLTVVTSILAIAALGCEWAETGADCRSGFTDVALVCALAALAVVAFLVPIVSAVMVARASRIR